MESHERIGADFAQDGDRLNMEVQKHRLIELIESEFGLLDKLLSCGALTKVKIAKVKSGATLFEKNEFLLNDIFSENKHQDLMKALSDCGQHHVVNWVKGNGEYKEEFGLDWPLRETDEKILDCNQETLIDLLSADELLHKLFSLGVFNKRQRDSIDSEKTEAKKNEALLDAVRRFSLKSYLTFKECLRQSGQSHVADILENGGVVVPVHATLECENLDEVETQIVNQMADVLMANASMEQADRLLAALQLKIIAVRRGKSIVSYISCKKEKEFDHLCKIIDNLEMRVILEQLFNQLIPNVKIKVLLVNISSKDMEKAQKMFKGMKSSCKSKGSVNNLLCAIDDLPLELTDIILQKSYLLSILRQRKDEEVIKELGSVDFCWLQRITRKRFKNSALFKFKKHCEDKSELYLIYKNNQQFFEEIHQISANTNMTPSTDHLSNSGSANGKRKRSLKKRQTENQMLRKAFLEPENEESVFKDFLSSYDPKEQKLICEIMNTGGGATRVEIRMPLTPLTKFKLIPQQFEDGEMKILRSVADRGAVVWIWCHSNNALQKLNNRDGLKKLIAIVHQSGKATSDVLEHKTNIDCDHLKKNIVSIPFVFVDFRTKLNFKRETQSENRYSYAHIDRIIDVTKLRMKIYVLCIIRNWSLTEEDSYSSDSDSENDAGNRSHSTMICVFEDRSPYSMVEDILLRGFEFDSILSSAKKNCLYLLTSGDIRKQSADEVLRVEIKENEESSLKHPSKWLELEEGYCRRALSISRDEDLMMVNRISPIILRIYDPDARLRLSLTLHEDIKRTCKAVESSNGNFIILHSRERSTRDINDGDRSNGTIEKERGFVWTVSEVSRDGKTIIRSFIPQNQQQQIGIPYNYADGPFFGGGDLCVDSVGRVFVTDTYNHRVIVLDSYLRWIGILNPRVKNGDENEKPLFPYKLFYDEDSHEMIIIRERDRDKVSIYDLIWI